jgi:hypothetical protein
MTDAAKEHYVKQPFDKPDYPITPGLGWYSGTHGDPRYMDVMAWDCIHGNPDNQPCGHCVEEAEHGR